MPIDFPNNPTSGQTYSYAGQQWEYNGVAWDKLIIADNANALYGISGSIYASSLATGLLYGGIISINAGNSAYFDITAGKGQIHTSGSTYTADPQPTLQYVTWPAQTGITLTYLATNDTTWIYIDGTGTVQQRTEYYTDTQLETTIIIGQLVHPSRTFINLARTNPNVAYATDKQYEQFIRSFGPIKISGHTIQPNGANLKLNRTSGTAFSLGRNWINDTDNPSVVSDGARTDCIFYRYYRGATAGTFITVPNQTVIDPTKYDDGTGTLASVPGGKYTIQRLFYYPNTPTLLGVYYGRAEYTSLADAAANINFENFTEIENTRTNAIFVGYLLIKSGCTDITNTSDALILQAGNFRSTTSGGGSISLMLDDLTDVIITSPQNYQVLTYVDGVTGWENLSVTTLPLVSSFNGLTGAVTGVTTGTANTFGPLQSFTSGISAAGGITFANDISVNNLTIGQGPVSGSSNTAIGEFALASLQTGSNNTAVGAYALSSATAGTYNVAIGDSAMTAATNAGDNNVAIGAFALNNNDGGSDNLAIGNYALFDNRSGQFNVVIGNDALDGNETGSRNIAIGNSSLGAFGNTANSDNVAIGSSSLLTLNSGNQNTAIGTFAGRRRGSGSTSLLSATGAIYIGYDARASADAQTNEIVIGNFAVGLGSNTAVIGRNTQTSATIYGLVNAPSGISAAGATFSGNIRLQNQEFIQNTTNGRMDFMPAPAGSTHYGMYLDFTTWSYGVKLGTIRASDSALNAAGFLWEAPLTVNTDVQFNLGSDAQYNILRTATGNDTAQFVVNCTTGQNSGAFALVDNNGAQTANRSPGVTHANPNLYVYRSGSARATDFIRFEHDGSTGYMISGGTSDIELMPGSGIVGVSGNIQVLQNQIYVTNNARSWFL